MNTPSYIKRAVAVAAAAGRVLGSAGLASAQKVVTVVPGDNGDGRTVVVNSPGMDITFESIDRETGAVGVKLVNNTGRQLYCEAPSEDAAARRGGTVAPVPVVEKSIEYYSKFQNIKAETFAFSQSSITMNLPLWPITQFVPQGSVGTMMGPAVALRSEIQASYSDALVKGLVGTTGGYLLNNGAETTRTIPLGVPAVAPRVDERLGFFVVCGAGANSAAVQGTANLYAWSVLEDEVVPEPSEPGEPGESGAISTSSLGSSDDNPLSSGSTGSGGNNDGDDDGDDDGGDDGDGGDGDGDGGGDA